MHPVHNSRYTSWWIPSVVLFISLCYKQTGFIKASESYGSAEVFPVLSLEEGQEKSRVCRFDSYTSDSGKTCEELNGVGSLNTICLLNSDLQLDGDLCVTGTGSIVFDPHVSIWCPIEGCSISLNVSGNVKLGAYATLVASSISIEATNISLEQHSSLNTTSLGGLPPSQTSGTPSTYDGSGGGHGGRGASCIKSNKTNWGGDVYAWSSLSDPWSYGSKGGSTSSGMQYGGGGGGRVLLKANDTLIIDGSVTAEGGEGGLKGGGGSGGSIRIHSLKLKGDGVISASGGRGWGGGGGGRIALDCYSVQDVKITSHGGQSIGCPENAGGAGTTFDKALHSLKVSNDNLTTETETPLLDFPNVKLWSNIFVVDNAKVLVPLLWTRVQVRSQIKLLNGGGISFGLSDHPVSEFELVAEELLMSDSIIKVYGAFRMYVKLLLMWNSRIQIDGGNSADVGASFLEARNLVVLRQNSVISSNADLGVSGQGLLKLSGNGDAIKGRRLFLSLFYNIEVGPGSLLQAPLDDDTGSTLATESQCESQICPVELIMPPEDCHVNSSLSFTLQICRVEDIIVSGSIRGSILHVHRARTVVVDPGGTITSSKLGCKDGIGKGKFLVHGAGGGAGHGGSGGSGYFNGTLIEGGMEYGDADLPCELGSGSGGSNDMTQYIAGGGLIVIGSIKWPLSKLEIYGSMRADGQSHEVSNKDSTNSNTLLDGLGGGSGGTILLFLQEISIADNSSIAVVGGRGGPGGGGGGGGGRVHFHWSNIAYGDEYVQFAAINGTIDASGGSGRDGGLHGEPGTVTGKECPSGLFGTFCNECPVGTYKDVVGSDPSLCIPCVPRFFANRAAFTYVRGGATQPSCPYKCLSDKYRMPKCYTPFEELLYMFGGPLSFSFILMFSLVMLAFLLSAVRVKLLGTDISYLRPSSAQRHGPESFPCLLSLAEVQGPSRSEETQNHVHRMYFMGPNTFREPWHLPYSPPEAIIGIVYEDAFNRFIDEINSVAAYEWWEGSVHSILSVAAYPCAWSWKQWRRKKKINRLQEYVKSEYDHACLRSCRSRALYKGMKVGSTPDLMVAYIDFFLGGDEKRLVVASTISQRFPMCIIFGGDGSYMSPYYLHTDMLLSNLISQYVPIAVWDRFSAGFNAQLRTVSQRSIRSGLLPVILWLGSHGNPQLECHGLRVELGWFQATTSGYYQLGILLAVNEYFLNNGTHSNLLDASNTERLRKTGVRSNHLVQSQRSEASISHTTQHKRVTGGVNGGILNEVTLQSLDYKRDFLFPFSLLLQNTRPVALQETLQLVIALLLLGDLAVTLLMLLQFYWISLAAFLITLLVLPLSLLPPFPAGINALFSQGPRKSSLARIYALWNITSFSNIFVAFVCGVSYHKFSLKGLSSMIADSQSINRDDNLWWILPTVLLIIKSVQAVLVNLHIANVEIQDLSLFSPDPESFWAP